MTRRPGKKETVKFMLAESARDGSQVRVPERGGDIAT